MQLVAAVGIGVASYSSIFVCVEDFESLISSDLNCVMGDVARLV